MSCAKIHRCSQVRARKVSLKGGKPRCAANRSQVLLSSDPRSEVGSSSDRPKEAPQPSGEPAVVERHQNYILKERDYLCNGNTWDASVNAHIGSSVFQLPNPLISPAPSKVALSNKQSRNLSYENMKKPDSFNGVLPVDQEAGLARCINRIFENMYKDNDTSESGYGHLRWTLFNLHRRAECSLLYERLKASLQFGCLSRPKHLPNESLKSDIGIRQEFIGLWVANYSLGLLSAAVEVVVGRETLVDLPFPESSRGDDACTQNVCKKGLEASLDQYLIRNEDVPHAERSSPGWCWRYTMLRSMMVIYILDKAKQMNIIATNLYQSSSTVKSSLLFLRKLTASIHPTVGDIYRLLRPLGYHIQHIQHPLSEFSYSVENLAIDFRDGVRLSRLVELLLCSLGSPNYATRTTPTIVLEAGQSCFLSQHLIFPCAVRAQQIGNVQVALDTLRAVDGVDQIVGDLKAEDIVDGHRERTMTLLWALLGSSGFKSVDFDELRKKI
ncbi:hypothetical protein BDR22DRAFT_336320 [Usnea florida]